MLSSLSTVTLFLSLLGVLGQEGRGRALPWPLGEPPDSLTSEEEDKLNETACILDVILKSFPEKDCKPYKTPKDDKAVALTGSTGVSIEPAVLLADQVWDPKLVPIHP